jgi:hypothetical protein
MALTLVQGTGGLYPGHNLVQEMTDDAHPFAGHRWSVSRA